jgi:ligand-binding sensor domain-containing protein/serine phosphatase RsbU (regulator of sigma subunit)
MKHPYILCVLLVLLPILMPSRAFSQRKEYSFENMGIKHGLSQSTVQNMLQDKKGFLWFGTQDGLNRFDGYSFKVFRPDFDKPDNSMTSGFIQHLMQDVNGNIYFRTQGGDFNLYCPAQNRFFHWKHQPGNKNSIAGTNIFYVFADPKGNYWFLHDKGFSRMSFPLKNNYDSVTVENFQSFFGLKIGELTQGNIDFIPVKNNDFVFAKGDKTYFLDHRNTDFHQYNVSNPPEHSLVLPFNRFACLQTGTDRESNLWLLYADRIEKITDFKKFSRQTYSFKQRVDEKMISHVFVGSDSCAYLAMPYKGVLSINLKTGETISIRKEMGNEKSIQSDLISGGMLEDTKGNIWFATSTGLSKYNPHKYKFQHFVPKPGDNNWLQDAWPFSFGEDKQGDLWVGTYHGKGIFIYNKKQNSFRMLSPVKSPGALPGANDVFSILKDKDGQMWIGTISSGLARYNEQKNNFTFYLHCPNDSESISSNYVNMLKEDKLGNIWIATAQGLNKFDKKTNKFKQYLYGEKSQLTALGYDNFITSILLNDDGSLWLGTQNGLRKMWFDKQENAQYRKYSANAKDSTSLSLNQIFSLIRDKQNYVWVATIGGGINRFDEKTGKFKRYTMKNGLANNNVYGLLIDDYGRIWASTNYGLSMLDPKTDRFVNYTVNHGLQSNEFNQGAYFTDSEGLMYFGGVNGYNVFRPASIQLDTSSAEVIFTDFKLFNKSVLPGISSPLKESVTYATEIKLSYWQRDFTFEFASTNYSSPENNQFAYMIENYHNDWVHLGKNRSISFTGFPHGEYILKVKASNADGVWSNKIATIRLVVLPPFWKTFWFNALIVLFLIIGVVLVIRLRTRKLQIDKKILEEKVVERTTEIERQKDEIVEKNEELNLMNEEISAQRDNMMELNEELVAKNEEIISQKTDIEIKNKSITASIQYAQRIQAAVLPTSDILDGHFQQHFILFQPRDIVSGDFYFVKKVDTRLIVAAADCTGHGVPGAFMSMLGIALLNEIVRNKEVSTAAQALDLLRDYVKTALQQIGKAGEQQDGMDIAFCAIDLETKIMSFAGAHNPCWVFRSGLIELPADHIPVGVYAKERPFTEHVFQLQQGDTIYLFSDGYHSQFGGGKNEKLKTKRLREIITEINQLPLFEQKQILEQRFEAWKGHQPQTDDVLVIGMQV